MADVLGPSCLPGSDAPEVVLLASRQSGFERVVLWDAFFDCVRVLHGS